MTSVLLLAQSLVDAGVTLDPSNCTDLDYRLVAFDGVTVISAVKVSRRCVFRRAKAAEPQYCAKSASLILRTYDWLISDYSIGPCMVTSLRKGGSPSKCFIVKFSAYLKLSGGRT